MMYKKIKALAALPVLGQGGFLRNLNLMLVGACTAGPPTVRGIF